MIGTVILFGFLVVALAVYQAQVVPQDNAQVEFEHSQEVENDVNDLRNAILRAGSTGSAQSQRVRLGTRYPQRTFFVNPPPATGSIETTDDREIEFDGITVNESAAHENVVEFWDSEPDFTTRSVRYTPDYNEFRDAPTLTYEHSVVGAEFPNDATLFRTGQTAVRSDRVSLTTLSGTVSENGVESRSIDPEAVSAGTRTIPIDVEAGDGIVLPTALSNETRAAELWTSRFESEGIPVTATPVEGNDEIRLEFTESGEYRLRLSEVALDGQGVTEPAYIVPVGSQTVSPNSEIGVEVRDKYNNPVSGATVTIDGDRFTTDDDGRVFTSVGSSEVNANIGDEDWEIIEFEVTDPEAEEDGEGRVNPFTRLGVRFDGAVTDPEDYTLRFTNTGENSVEITRFRMSFYQLGSPGTGNRAPPTSGVLISDGDEIADFEVRGDVVDIEGEGVILPAGEENQPLEVLTIEFDDGRIEPDRDWFIITLRFDDGEVQRSGQYFVAV